MPEPFDLIATYQLRLKENSAEPSCSSEVGESSFTLRDNLNPAKKIGAHPTSHVRNGASRRRLGAPVVRSIARRATGADRTHLVHSRQARGLTPLQAIGVRLTGLGDGRLERRDDAA